MGSGNRGIGLQNKGMGLGIWGIGMESEYLKEWDLGSKLYL